MNSATTSQLLKGIGKKIATVDHLLVYLMARRIQLSRQVAVAKLGGGQSTVHLGREEERLQQVRQWAREWGMNPNFASSLLYAIIGESCKVQTQLRDENGNKAPPQESGEKWRDHLKENLHTLTSRIAAMFNECYRTDFFATQLELAFEHSELSTLCQDMQRRDMLVDLGCATGRELLQHAATFNRLIGYDLSPEMVEVATRTALDRGVENAEFVVHDFELNGIPLAKASVSCVFMNQGTGSDVPNMEHVIAETERILETGGRFLFSFCNADSLVGKVFLPWPLSLAAEVDKCRSCVSVYCPGKKTEACGAGEEEPGQMLDVFCRTYTVGEVKSLFPENLRITACLTHPTLSAIMPDHLFDDETMSNTIAVLDSDLANSNRNLGAYIVVTGKKVA